MREILETCVIRPFYDFYGEDGFTYCLPLYKPTAVLLEVCGDEPIDKIEERVDWALSDGLIFVTKTHDLGLGNYGTAGNTVCAEICLCLARRIHDAEKRQKLLAKGVFLARVAQRRCEGKEDNAAMPTARQRNTPILRDLETLAKEYDVNEEIIAAYEPT
jgi:hypothetical protein